MYNIMEFIDNDEVREHNKGRVFSPAEEIAIICGSHKTDINMKMDALIELAEKYLHDEEYQFESVGIDLENYTVRLVSVHDTILNTVDVWKHLLKGDKCFSSAVPIYFVYTYTGTDIPEKAENIFATLQNAMDYITSYAYDKNACIKRYYIWAPGIDGDDIDYFYYVNGTLSIIDMSKRFRRENWSLGFNIMDLKCKSLAK